MIRQMSVNDKFYPDDTQELHRYFKHFESVYDEHSKLTDLKTRAVIVPHAGYVYSGFTASIAYRLLAKNNIKKFVLIGPSHRIAFNGLSMCDFNTYNTPLGEIKADKELYKEIQNNFSTQSLAEAHFEHSTEVQFPFLKHYIDDISIVEIVYSNADANHISKIITHILKTDDCGVIISTDLSHFYSKSQANILDAICLESIKNLDINKLKSGCEACGLTGIKALMLSAKELSLTPHILDYRTSGDITNETSNVVGYMSACFT